MRPRCLIPLTLVAALFVAAACRGDKIEPEPEKKDRLVSVSVSETTVVMPEEGSVEISFKVEDPGYVFNYAAGTPGCQVRLSGKDGKAPSEFEISRITPGTEAGAYTAVLKETGVETDYIREVRLLVENSNYLSANTFVPSNYFTVRSEAAGYGVLVKTGLPTVYVNTLNGKSVTSKTTFLPGTLQIKGEGGYEGLEEVNCEIRGRGNTTWTWPKKPYLVKLEEKQHIFGMHKHKRWVLLANFMDRTLMRNLVSMKVTPWLYWTP